MIKSPFTKQGDVNYFELLKIVILLSAFYLLISAALSSASVISHATPLGIFLVSLLTVTQLLISSVNSYKEVKELLISLIIHNIRLSLKLPLLKYIETVSNTYYQQQKNKTYLRYNVIRC